MRRACKCIAHVGLVKMNHSARFGFSSLACVRTIATLLVMLLLATQCTPAPAQEPPRAPASSASSPTAVVTPSVTAGSAPTIPPMTLDLFSDVSIQPRATPDPIVIRARLVSVNFDLLAGVDSPPSSSTSKKTLRLNLFADAIYTAVPERVEPNPNGFVWFGHIEGADKSQVTLVVNNKVMSGNLRVAGKFYQIRYVGDQIHAIQEINPKAFPPD